MTQFRRSLPASLSLALLAWAAMAGTPSPPAMAQEEPLVDLPAIPRPRPAPEQATDPPAPAEPEAPVAADPRLPAAPRGREAPGPAAPARPTPSPALSASEGPAAKTDSPAASGPSASELEEEDSAAMGTDMARLFPLGRVFEGVRVPSFSGDTLNAVVHADFMRRSSEEMLEMEILDIALYENGAPDYRILTDHAYFSLVDGILHSTTPAKVVGKSFEMRGQRLVFNSNTREGHMMGRVKTVIQDLGGLNSPNRSDSDPETASAP